MLKLLFVGILLFIAYRLFFQPGGRTIGGRSDRERIRNRDREASNEDEYIDYEEVE